MDILYLSHCVPNPPDKGEKIRAFHELKHLWKKHQVHLACFARTPAEMKDAEDLKNCCASVHAEVRPFRKALAMAGARFALGDCLNQAFFRSSTMRAQVRRLAAATKFDATIAYTLPMAQYAPPDVPLLLDLVDVDSEKWFQYARTRAPGFLYSLEARRLRRAEIECAGRAHATFLAARLEADLFRRIAPHVDSLCMENGVALDRFDPEVTPELPELRVRKFMVFVGTMDYHPNVDGARWFAREVFPEIRRRQPEAEFLIVGNKPVREVLELAKIEGVVVTGGVDDVRPYIAQARAVVAPLQLARGIQNKVLEGLALGRPVYGSTAICQTFGREIPKGLRECKTAADFIAQILPDMNSLPAPDRDIREQMMLRFRWENNLELLDSRLESLTRPLDQPRLTSLSGVKV